MSERPPHVSAAGSIGVAYVVLGVVFILDQLELLSLNWPILLALTLIVVGLALLAGTLIADGRRRHA